MNMKCSTDRYKIAFFPMIYVLNLLEVFMNNDPKQISLGGSVAHFNKIFRNDRDLLCNSNFPKRRTDEVVSCLVSYD